MSKCDYCQHVEMCGWREHLEERGCDFFDDGNKWIPISERLPDKDKYNRGSVWERSVLVTAYFKWDDAKQTFITMGLAEDVINNNFIDECIIAWMPLPKPYEPQERSE